MSTENEYPEAGTELPLTDVNADPDSEDGCCQACGCQESHHCPVCGMAMASDHHCACEAPPPHCNHGCPGAPHAHEDDACAHRGRGGHGGHRGHGGHEHHSRRQQVMNVGIGVAIGALAATDLVLKVVAVRRALKRGDKGWVLPLAVLNTVGILPAAYLSTHASSAIAVGDTE